MAVDCYLYLIDEGGEPIKGECTDAVYEDCIEIFKFDFDAVSQVDAGKLLGDAALTTTTLIGNGPIIVGDPTQALPTSQALVQQAQDEQTGKDSFTFSLEKSMDISSPRLFQAFCRNTSREKGVPAFKGAIVYVLIGGMKRDPKASPESQCMLMMEFENLQITQYQLKHDADLNIPDEKLTFYFESYLMTYRWQEPDGSLTAKPPKSSGYHFTKLKELP